MQFCFQVSEIWLSQNRWNHEKVGAVKRDSSWFQSHISRSRWATATYFFQVVLVLSTATWHGFIGITFLDREICLCRNHSESCFCGFAIFCDLRLMFSESYLRVQKRYNGANFPGSSTIEYCNLAKCHLKHPPGSWHRALRKFAVKTRFWFIFFWIFTIFSKSYLSN